MGVVRSRWDPVKRDYVEVDRQPSIFRLQRLGPGYPVDFTDPDSLSDHENLLNDLATRDTTLDVEGKKVAIVKHDGDWPPVRCTFANFSVDVWANRVTLFCESLTEQAVDATQQFGQKSGMALILPDQVLVFHHDTLEFIPRLWGDHLDVKKVTGRELLTKTLSESHEVQGKALAVASAFEFQAIPGIWPQRTCAHFYEVQNSQDAQTHLRGLLEVHRQKVRETNGRGTIRGANWLATIKSVGTFAIAEYTGEISLKVIHDYCEQAGLRHGYASNFETLVLNNGQSFHLHWQAFRKT